MHIDDALHSRLIGEANVMKETAPQKRVGQLFFIIAGNDDQGPMSGFYQFARFVDKKLHPIQFAQ